VHTRCTRSVVPLREPSESGDRRCAASRPLAPAADRWFSFFEEQTVFTPDALAWFLRGVCS